MSAMLYIGLFKLETVESGRRGFELGATDILPAIVVVPVDVEDLLPLHTQDATNPTG